MMDLEKQGKGADIGASVVDGDGMYFSALSGAGSSAFGGPGSTNNLFHRVWKNALMASLVVASIVSNARGVTCSILRKYNNGGNAAGSGGATPSSESSLAASASSPPTIFKAAGAVAIVLVTPFIIWDGFPNPDILSVLKHVELVWTALLHCSMWPVAVIACIAGMLHGKAIALHPTSNASATANKQSRCRSRTVWSSVGSVVAAFTLLIVVLSQLQVIFPSWAWNPFVWFKFPIYLPPDIAPAMQGLCIDKDAYYKNPQMPLCLSPSSWDTLSSGVLSSRNHQDVATVLKGVDYARQHKIIIAVMSRDTNDAIPILRQNVEGMSPFFQDLAVVVFENDSKDGSRESFKGWSNDAKGYSVDLMTCGDGNPDCKFGMSHRYDSTEFKDYFTSSAIGKMAEFRQRIVDYVAASPKYQDFSHMVVVDIDLQVSFSPLGLMHTLGLDLADDYAIASTGRQTWPGSLGTLTPQYDFSAFRALETPANKRLHDYHRMFCGLLPPGDRWRNQCDAISPMHLFMVLNHEWLGGGNAYPVESAFNGATLYPMELIRSTHAKYDAGDDLQRCEHIGFNLSLKRHMYVNPKWDFHLMPTNPGGPTGIRALKNVFRIVFVPRLSLVIFFQNVIFMSMFVYAMVTLGVFSVTRWSRQHRRGDSETLMLLPVSNSVSKEL